METTAWSGTGRVEVAERPEVAPDPQVSPREAVLEHIAREGYAFDFDQLLYLLELMHPERALPAGEGLGSVRVRPDIALAFPASDVRRVEVDEGTGQIDVTVTFMGLCGIGSPLPEFFYDRLTSEHEDDFALRDFLDIFSHRFYAAFYRAWKKHRPELWREDDGSDRESLRFLALGGLGTARVLERAPVSRFLLMAFAGHLTAPVRHAEGLEQILASWLELPVEVIENVERWVPMREPPQMGQGGGMKLGEITVGQRVLDRSGKFRLRIGPMGRSAYLDLLPGGARAEGLEWLVRTYLTDYLDFDVELRLQAGDLPPTRLGDASCRLGLTTCLGSPTEPVTSRVVQYA